jgi:cell division initiation protein
VKLSPLDIQHHEFSTAMRGYDKAQVRDFLEQAAEALEAIARDNQALKAELSKRDALIDELRSGESELRRAVVSAERLGSELKTRAQEDAERVLQDARGERAVILRDAELQLRELKAEFARTEREHRLFREQFRGMLRAYERSLDSVPDVLSVNLEPQSD